MADMQAAMMKAKQRSMGGQPPVQPQDPAMDQEKAEEAGWSKVIELCQSGDPKALQAIQQIATEELQAQKQEEAQMGGEEDQEQAQPQPQGQPQQ